MTTHSITNTNYNSIDDLNRALKIMEGQFEKKPSASEIDNLTKIIPNLEYKGKKLEEWNSQLLKSKENNNNAKKESVQVQLESSIQVWQKLYNACQNKVSNRNSAKYQPNLGSTGIEKSLDSVENNFDLPKAGVDISEPPFEFYAEYIKSWSLKEKILKDPQKCFQEIESRFQASLYVSNGHIVRTLAQIISLLDTDCTIRVIDQMFAYIGDKYKK